MIELLFFIYSCLETLVLLISDWLSPYKRNIGWFMAGALTATMLWCVIGMCNVQPRQRHVVVSRVFVGNAAVVTVPVAAPVIKRREDK